MNTFNLETRGTGRLVHLRKKKNHYLLRIIAFRGSLQDLQCTRFDCVADTPETMATIQMLEPLFWEHEQESASIPVRFALTGLRPNLFVFKRGKRKGETEVFLNARVSQLSLDPQSHMQIPKDSDQQESTLAFAFGYLAGNLAMRFIRML